MKSGQLEQNDDAGKGKSEIRREDADYAEADAGRPQAHVDHVVGNQINQSNETHDAGAQKPGILCKKKT